MEIVSKEDFGGDLTRNASLSPLDCLAIVAEKAFEKEGFNAKQPEKKPRAEAEPLVFNFNVMNHKPRTTNYKRRRSPLRFPDLNLPQQQQPNKKKSKKTITGPSSPAHLVFAKQLQLQECEMGKGHLKKEEEKVWCIRAAHNNRLCFKMVKPITSSLSLL